MESNLKIAVVATSTNSESNLNETLDNFFWYITIVSLTALAMFILTSVASILYLGQKTRNPQQRRAYIGSRQRPSLSQSEPTIYVSPANYPPPPKYEAMAPPSYDEVVGVHYPSFQPVQFQPITQPIEAALAQSSNVTNEVTIPVASGAAQVNNINRVNDTPPATVVTTDERTTTTTVAT